MKVVLAYSGGLDTSVCVRILQEKYGYDVVTVTVDVGIDRKEIEEAEAKARALGVVEHYTIDAREEFVRDYIFRAIKTNADYEGYPLSTALARPLIAKKVVEIAEKEGAEALAHGSTGKGNDQFRFEAVFRTLVPDKKIIAPVRELNLTREESIAYARKHGIPVAAKKDKPWSIDENLWGRSIEGGELENPASEPSDEIFEWTMVKRKETEYLDIYFEEGVPQKLNGKRFEPVELIMEANKIAGEHGIGRIDMIEDRIVGFKARENYECPAASVLIEAHRALEALTLTRQELRFKAGVEQSWSELVYHGLWNEPLRFALDAFTDTTSSRVTGNVRLRLENKSFAVVSRSSPYSLYSLEAVSFEDKSMDQREVEGVLKYHSYQAGRYYAAKKS
ncbi:MAG TPA: argininosuccinate synthase [Euryarchaeota archaeon]|nr:argininosuccinate synthase [archaeon BMS3Bbin15]HDL15547.1 argininosuccinate synthase [Euryarchaeota archaeon]